jgi:hypothetical protein
MRGSTFKMKGIMNFELRIFNFEPDISPDSSKNPFVRRYEAEKIAADSRFPAPENKKIFPKEDHQLRKKWQATYIAPLNHIPLLCSHPGGVCRSWSCRTCRRKYTIFLFFRKPKQAYKFVCILQHQKFYDEKA